MIATIFRSNRPAILLGVPLVALALMLPAFGAAAPPRTGLMPLAALVEHLVGNEGWTRHLLALLLVIALSVQLATLMNALELMDRRNHLVALLFPVLLCGLGGHSYYEPALLGMPIVLFALRRTWSVGNNGPALGVAFDAGLLLGIAALCYLPYAFLIAVVWASISVIRPFAWREYVLPVVGFGIVFYLTWVILRISGHGPWNALHTIAHYREETGVAMRQTGARLVFWIVTGLVLLSSLAAFSAGYGRSIMRGKNLRSAFLGFCTALGVLAVFLGLLNGVFPTVLIALPLAALCSYTFMAPKRPWLAETILLTLVGLSIWSSWAG